MRPGTRPLPALFGSFCLALGCGDEPAPREEPFFPADYASTYVEVRDCRLSGEHDLSPIRVLADPETAAAYTARDRGFDSGAVVLKVEYEYADPTCQGEIQRWTVMLREIEGSSPETLDWKWQDVRGGREVFSTNEARCIGCHTSCGVPPGGYLGTCTEE